MKNKNQAVQRVNFSQSAAKNDPVALIRKRIDYLSKAEKIQPETTQRFQKEITASIRDVRKLAEKRHGPEAVRLAAEADALAEQLRLALKGKPMRDHVAAPDPCTCSFHKGETPCST
jgi:hypothetical protein